MSTQIKLHGIFLNCSFNIKYSKGKWVIQDLDCDETEIEPIDLAKLVLASKSEEEVELKIGRIQGKAKIMELFYNPTSGKLEHITFEITEMIKKEIGQIKDEKDKNKKKP